MREFYVHGHAISVEIQEALIAKMKSGPFKASSIEAEAVRLGVPSLGVSNPPGPRAPVAMRVADRIIQRERKAGHLEFQRPMWIWVGGIEKKSMP